MPEERAQMELVQLTAINLLSNALDEAVEALMTAGADKMVVVQFRRLLPPWCKHTMHKEKGDNVT